MEILEYIIENKEKLKNYKNIFINEIELENRENLERFLKREIKNGETNIEYLARIGFFDRMSKDINKPLIFDGKLQPIFDMNEMIFEKVYVETPLDTDEDGKRDLIAVYIKRPKETLNGMKVPAIYVANPYMMTCEEEVYENNLHKVDMDLEIFLGKDEQKIEIKEEILPEERKSSKITDRAPTDNVQLDCITEWFEYCNSRGIASVYSAGIGTKESEGINSTGSKSEQKWVIAVIEWLTGKRKAYTDKINNIEIKASWCNGNIAMTGKSYLGTLSIAAAVTGVNGLKTIIPQAAISSWYDYYRMNGVIAAPLGWQGDDADLLTKYCRSRKCFDDREKLLAKKKVEEMEILSNRNNGNYNNYWQERDYLLDVANIKASIFIVHGINDWNVKTNQCYNLWKELKKYNILSKMILHQGEHIYIDTLSGLNFNHIMNKWLSYWLYDIKNNILDELPDILVQSNIQQEKWLKIEKDEEIKTKVYTLDKDKHLILENDSREKFENSIELIDDIEKLGFCRNRLNYEEWRKELVSPENRKSKILYLSDKLDKDIVLCGDIEVSLNIKSAQNKGLISVMLLEYGKMKRLTSNQEYLENNFIKLGRKASKVKKFLFSKEEVESKYKIISRGHLNLQNRDGKEIKSEILEGKEYNYKINMIPTNYIFSKGSRLGLIIYGTDVEITQRPLEKMKYWIKEEEIKLKINILELE